MLSPYRGEHGIRLRRYKRRWKVERTISWLHNFRRLVVRYEFYSCLYHGFAMLACLIMAARRF
jgi:transposase